MTGIHYLHVFHVLCTVVAAPAMLYKLNSLRRSPHDAVLRALCATMGLSFLTLLLVQSTVRNWLDRLTHCTCTTPVLFQLSIIALLTSQQVALARWSHPPPRARAQTRRFVLAAVAAQLLLVPLFLCIANSDPADMSFALRSTLFIAYVLIDIGIYSLGAVQVARQSRHYARLSHRLWLRRGLNLNAAGTALTLGYTLSQLGTIADASLSTHLRTWDRLTWMCGDAGTALALVGWTLPGWGPLISRLQYRLRLHSQHRRLENLWRALSSATPTIKLGCPAFTLRERLRTRTAEYRLYRRVIEIRDGQLALIHRLDPAVADRAKQARHHATLTDHELRAIATAAQIASALQSHTRTAPRPLPSLDMPKAVEPNTTDLHEEIDWLIQLAWAYDRSSFVRSIRNSAGS